MLHEPLAQVAAGEVLHHHVQLRLLRVGIGVEVGVGVRVRVGIGVEVGVGVRVRVGLEVRAIG